MFEKINNQVKFPEVEEEILSFWNQNNIFEKSKGIRKGAPEYVFYDGPPFATGLPHYGHILASTVKDIVPRYWAMRGHYVERRFGWDCHGLPVEMEIQKQLELNTTADIQSYGVEKFNQACRAIVNRYAKEWEKIISRMGRWVDFRNDYKTMHTSFMESVWWVFKTLYDKGLIYRGFKVMPYSWKAGTILSNFEENLNYKDVQDYAITIKFPTVTESNEKEYFLAWTTTPWTLIANLALAVGEHLRYIKIKHIESKEFYILLEKTCSRIFKEGEYETVTQFLGKDLIGKRYRPLFSFAQKKFSQEQLKNAFQVLGGEDIINEDEGVGIVHMAPAYGEEDFTLCSAAGLPCYDPINDAGDFTSEVDFISGTNFKDAEKTIIRDLKNRNLLLKQSSIQHSYPYCWRTDTPLMYKAISTWFVAVTKFKKELIANNQKIHWEPEHIKNGRFGKWLENARDWAISRNRFWGTPIPIWESNDGDFLCFGDITSLSSASGKSLEKITDLHKENMDEIVLTHQGKTYKRVPEVLDCWFESGSMPYGQNHYPFEKKEDFEKTFPAHFISEGLDQTRGWFYTLLVVSTGLFNKPSFQNVVVSGLILAEDGKKMSKRLKNYPDPSYILDNYGADALRVYLISSPVIKADTLKFSENGLKEIMKSIMIPLWNVFSFLTTYAEIDGWKPPESPPKLEQPLDLWLFSSRETMIRQVNAAMEKYRLFQAVPPLIDYIEKLTNIYVRRSRKRFWKSENDDDKHQAYFTLYTNLRCFAVVIAPFMPFVSEKIYRVLRRDQDPISVHLEDFPLYNPSAVDVELEREMKWVNDLLTMARSLRLKHKLKIRQPLREMVVITQENPVIIGYLGRNRDIILEELNLKEVTLKFNETEYVNYHAKINFQTVGRKLGPKIKPLSKKITALSHEEIITVIKTGKWSCELNGETIILDMHDLDIRRTEKAGHVILNQGEITCVLDTYLDNELIAEGYARECINRIQKLRKDLNLEYTDRITIRFSCENKLREILTSQSEIILKETLGNNLSYHKTLPEVKEDELNGEICRIQVIKD